MNRAGSLEVGQDTIFQRYQWTVQRWGWAILALVLLAALLGLLGRGPLSSTDAEAPDQSLRVKYNRFIRVRAPADLKISVAAKASQNGAIRLWIDREYLDHLQVKHITPRPEHEEAGSDRHIFVFRAAAPGNPVEIVLHFEPEKPGPHTCRVGLVDGPELSFEQFAYP